MSDPLTCLGRVEAMKFLEKIEAIARAVESMTPAERKRMLAYLYGRDDKSLNAAVRLATEGR